VAVSLAWLSVVCEKEKLLTWLSIAEHHHICCGLSQPVCWVICLVLVKNIAKSLLTLTLPTSQLCDSLNLCRHLSGLVVMNHAIKETFIDFMAK